MFVEISNSLFNERIRMKISILNQILVTCDLPNFLFVVFFLFLNSNILRIKSKRICIILLDQIYHKKKGFLMDRQRIEQTRAAGVSSGCSELPENGSHGFQGSAHPHHKGETGIRTSNFHRVVHGVGPF